MLFLKVLLVPLFCAAVVSGAVTVSPTNEAVEVGESVTLSYKSNRNSIFSSLPTWTFYAERESPANEIRIAPGCQVVPNSSIHYRTVNRTKGECNLVVQNATIEQGGLYFCSVNGLDRRAALLTVVDVKLSINNTSEVVEGDRLNVSCSVRRSITIAPQQPLNLIWNGAAGPNIEDSVNNSDLLSSGIAVARPPVVPSFMCSVSFGPLIKIPYLNLTYSTNATSAVFRKTSGVIDVQLSTSTSTSTTTATTTSATSNTTANDQSSEHPPEAKPGEESNSTPVILGVGLVVGVGGSILLLIPLVLLLLWYFKKHKADPVETQRTEGEFDNMKIERTDDPHYQPLHFLSTQPQETYEQLRTATVATMEGDYDNQVQYDNIR